MKVRKAIVECFFVLIAPMTVCVSSKFSLLISLRYDSSREGLVGGVTRVGYHGTDLQVFETKTS